MDAFSVARTKESNNQKWLKISYLKTLLPNPVPHSYGGERGEGTVITSVFMSVCFPIELCNSSPIIG